MKFLESYKGYHGSEYKNHNFSLDNIGNRVSKLGFFFTSDEEFASMFGEHTTEHKIDLDNPYVIDQDTWWDWRDIEHDEDWFIAKRKELIENGYDGVIAKSDDNLSDTIIAFYPQQIKGINEVFDFSKKTWEPLYIFLKNIFGDKYKDAADGFMYMGHVDELNGKKLGKTFYEYKHGITRKYVILDEDGNTYKFDYNYQNDISALVNISYEEAFKNVYKNLGFYAKGYEKETGEKLKDIYLISYSKFRKYRDELLNDMGYNTMTLDKNKDIDKLKESINIDDLRNKYPNMIFTFDKNDKGYFVRADIKTQGNKKEYLGALKGPVTKEVGLKWLKNMAESEYDKYY